MLRCKNTTNNNSCKTPKEINEKITEGFFEFFYTDMHLIDSNYTNPMQYHFEVFFTILGANSHNNVNLFFKTVNITTDSGYVFEEKKTKTFINYDYSKEEVVVNPTDDNLIIDFFINSSKSTHDISRRYIKLTEVLATIGGILNICLVAGSNISSFFSVIQMKIKMLNTLFFFDIEANAGPKRNTKDKKSMNFFNREAILLSKIKHSIESYKNPNYLKQFSPKNKRLKEEKGKLV